MRLPGNLIVKGTDVSVLMSEYNGVNPLICACKTMGANREEKDETSHCSTWISSLEKVSRNHVKTFPQRVVLGEVDEGESKQNGDLYKPTQVLLSIRLLASYLRHDQELSSRIHKGRQRSARLANEDAFR